MTRLSHQRGSASAGASATGPFPVLARVSLDIAAIVLIAAPSCLVTSTPDFPVPVASPPFLDANTALATPSGGNPVDLRHMIQIGPETAEVEFTAEVQAEDVGRPLAPRVFINYEGNDFLGFPGRGNELPPSVFEEVRTIRATLGTSTLDGLQDGCYQVSFVVTHQLDTGTLLPTNQADTAILVWWMIKGDPAQIPVTSCFGVQPSATIDGGE